MSIHNPITSLWVYFSCTPKSVVIFSVNMCVPLNSMVIWEIILIVLHLRSLSMGGIMIEQSVPIMGIRAGIATWSLLRERFTEPGPGQELWLAAVQGTMCCKAELSQCVGENTALHWGCPALPSSSRRQRLSQV